MVANTSFIAAFSSGKPADHLGTPAGYQRTFPAALLSAIHRVPVRHRIRVRTTNLAERSFVEERPASPTTSTRR